MRRLSLIVCLLICAAGTAWAQLHAGDVSMQVEIAGAPRVKGYEPVAIYVTLGNIGPPLEDAHLQVEVFDYAHRVRARVEQPVSLPTGAHKRIPLLIPTFLGYAQSQEPIPVKLIDGSGRVIAESVRGAAYPSSVSGNDCTLLVVSPNKADYNYLTTYKKAFGTAPNNATIYVDDIAPSVLPQHWAGLASCDFVILQDTQAMTMRPEQQRALLDYVTQGGSLLLVSNGDANQFNTSGLLEALPAKPIASVALDRVAGVTAAERAQFAAPNPLLLDMRPNPDAAVLRRCGAVPLLVARHWGLGTIYLSGVDLANTHTLTDGGLQSLWVDLLTHFHKQVKDTIRFDFNEALDFPPEMTPPSIGFLALFMLAYIALVGPLNYMVLRRRDRMLWTWITVPVLAIGFTVISYAISYNAKGSTLVVRELTILKMRQGSTSAYGHSFVGLFSPRRAAYDIKWPGRSMPRAEVADPGEEGQALTMSTDDGGGLRGLDIAMWSMRRVHSDAVRDLPGPIRMNLTRTGDRLKGEIVNDSGLDLGNSVVVLDDRATTVKLQAGRNVIDQQAAAVGPASLNAMLNRIAPAERRGLQSTITRLDDAVAQALGHRKQPVLIAWPPTPLIEAQVTPTPPAVDSANLLVVF